MTFLSLVVLLQNKSSGRVNRANQRKLASLFSAGDVSSDLAKYNQLKVSEGGRVIVCVCVCVRCSSPGHIPPIGS